MMDAFEARDASLGSLFTEYHDTIFQIPDFQRRFVWGKDEFTDFLESIIRNDKGYFIGTIVYAPSESKDLENPSINIIDGQQRLVTLFLAMAVIRDLLEDETSKQGQHAMHDEIQDSVSDLRSWLLLRNGSDRRIKIEFFDDNMNKYFRSITEKHTTLEALNVLESYVDRGLEDASEKIIHKKVARQFMEAYRTIRKVIEENAPSAKDLCQLVENIRSLQIIRFKCKRYELVHSLFEGLNSKGIKLTRSEQIKNILFDRIERLTAGDESAAKSLKGKWNDLEYAFDTLNSNKNLLDKFLRHHWVAHNKLVYMPQLYDVYKRKIDDLSSREQLAEFLDELNSASRFYIGIRRSVLNNNDFAYLTDKILIDKLNDFGLLDNDQILEVLLLYRQIILQKLVPKSVLKKWLAGLWVITFRLKYVSASPSDFEKELVKYLGSIRKIMTGGSSVKDYEMRQVTKGLLLDKLWPLVENSELFVSNISDKLSYSANNLRILTKVISDVLLQTNRGIIIKNPSIEHILPQKPAKWGFTGQEVKDIVNNFGNLSLLHDEDNQDAGNEPFVEKVKLVYNLSHFPLNKQIANYQKFKSKDLLEIEQAISTRGKDLAEIVETMYHLDKY